MQLASSARIALEIIERPVATLKPYPGNARTHSKKQVRQIASSIERFGFVNPEGIAITPDGSELWVGDDSVPVVKVVDLKSDQIVATLPTGGIAIRIAITGNGKTAITSNFDFGTFSIFDVQGRKPLRTIKISGSAKAMQVTTMLTDHDRRALVAETGDSRIAEIDLKAGQVIRRFSAGKNGDGLAISRVQCLVEKRFR